jgi:MoaA/NifB/PqqE/SkfB family radical SAM enzyme
MDWDLYRSIIDQSVDWGVKRFSPYLMNEPMLDSELPERIKYITDHKKPGQFTKINSHGNLLTERMAKGILDSGLDRVNFSVQGLDPEKYQEVMGLPLQKTLDNIDRILDLKRAGGYKLPRIRVCMLVTQYIEPQLPEIMKYWEARGVKVNLNKIESRGGHSSIKTEEIAVRKLAHFDWCNRLFNQMYILYDGRCVMCCADWEQKGVMGDASKETLAKIWNGFKYGCFRERFLNGHVRGMICENCSKDAVGADEED